MKNDFALSYVNPLRGLTEGRLATLLDDGQRGAYADLQWLFHYIEKRDPIARAVKRRLLSALGSLQWDIQLADAGDDAAKKEAAQRQADTLRAAYDRVKGLRPALNHLALAELRGFAHLEKIFSAGMPDGAGDPRAVAELRVVEQWFWVRDGIYGPWAYNRCGKQGVIHGEAVNAAAFIVREVDDPADEILAKLYVRKDMSDADWDGYLQRFGIPPTIIEGPPNVPPEKEAEYKAQAAKIATDATGYIPNGAKVHTVTPSTGSSVFKDRLDWLDAQMVIAGTGGKLTVLAEAGSGTLAGEAQKSAFDEIAEAIAQSIAEVMQEQFDKPLLAVAHPGEPVLAWFKFEAVDEEDRGSALDDAEKAARAGYTIDAEQLSERSGYKLSAITTNKTEAQPQATAANGQTAVMPPASPDSPPATIAAAKPPEVPAPPAAPRTPEQLQASAARQLGVTPDYLAPAAQEFGALLAAAQDGNLSADELLSSAQAVLDSIPALAEKMDVTGIAEALTQAMSGAISDAS